MMMNIRKNQISMIYWVYLHDDTAIEFGVIVYETITRNLGFCIIVHITSSIFIVYVVPRY